MKKFLLTTALMLLAVTSAHAQAAKPAAKPAATTTAPAAPKPAPLPWGGLYFGLNGGYGWGNVKFASPANQPTANTKGGLIGLQLGADFVRGNAVFGFALMTDGNSVHGTTPCPNPAYNCTSKFTWLGSATGRIGFGNANMLVYGRGGIAFGGYKFVMSNPTADTMQTQTFGWTAGAGAERVIADKISVFAEYNYYSLQKIVGSTAPNAVTVTATPTIQAVLVGLNWRH